jgi:cyclase
MPVLLIDEGRAEKTTRFRSPVYRGDPINIVRIFNQKAVDEIVVLDIGATRRRSCPDFDLADALASECFMPICFGGGISEPIHAEKLFALGVDKVCINSALDGNLALLGQIADLYGSQAVVASLDTKRSWRGGYSVLTRNGRKRLGGSPSDVANAVETAGAGEILLNSIEHDGCRDGYDLELIRSVTDSVDVPVVACGGAAGLEDFRVAIADGGASAAAAGSFFVFTERTSGVLISYPTQEALEREVYDLL